MYLPATQTMEELLEQGNELVYVPQVCYEFWSVATRPHSDNGLGLLPQQAESELHRISTLFTFLNDPSNLYDTWLQVVKTYSVLGKQSHDARLIAAMQLHQTNHILTFNQRDFSRFPGITVLTPDNVLKYKVKP